MFRNYFAALSVEETADEDEDLPAASDVKGLITPIPVTKSQTKPSDSEIYELVDELQTELSLQVFCFFEDLHILQGEVRRAWRSYKTRDLTLVAATSKLKLVYCIGTYADSYFLSHSHHHCRYRACWPS
jgi:hypothetical protein